MSSSCMAVIRTQKSSRVIITRCRGATVCALQLVKWENLQRGCLNERKLTYQDERLPEQVCSKQTKLLFLNGARRDVFFFSFFFFYTTTQSVFAAAARATTKKGERERRPDTDICAAMSHFSDGRLVHSSADWLSGTT